MPNWCDNVWIIRGNDASLAAFRQAARGLPPKWNDGDEQKPEQDLCFHALRPVPAAVLAKGYSAMDDDDGKSVEHRWADFEKGVESETHRDGWHWCNYHWGTKWGIPNERLTIKVENGTITYGFPTAWSPVDPLVKHVAPHFADLEFDLRYMEIEGVYFYGRVVAQGKTILVEESCDGIIAMDNYIEYGFGHEEDYCARFDKARASRAKRSRTSRACQEACGGIPGSERVNRDGQRTMHHPTPDELIENRQTPNKGA